MDVATDVIQPIPQAEQENSLSYDDTVAYEQQVPTTTETDPRSNLANRIGNTKIYLLSEATAAAHSAKVCTPHLPSCLDTKLTQASLPSLFRGSVARLVRLFRNLLRIGHASARCDGCGCA
jgi:hypothetical protein